MKKLMTFVFAGAVVLYLSGSEGYAQRGRTGGGPPMHDPANNPGGKDMGHEKGSSAHDASKTTASQDAKIVDHINDNPQLKAKVQSLLPAGTNLQTAAQGFKNQGEFIAALHVSKNLNIPFDQLKAKVTGPNSVSLGKAVQELKPDMTAKQAKVEVGKAEKQAKDTENTKSTR